MIKSNNFTYLARQGIRSVWLNRVMSVASIGVLAACTFIIGVAALLSININSAMVSLENQNEMVVFLNDEITTGEDEAIREVLKSDANIASYYYVSKDAALEEQKEYLGDMAHLLDTYVGDDNPLPASYRITLTDLELLSDTEASFRGMGGIKSISSPTLVAQTLTSLEKTLTMVGMIIVGVLLLVTLIIISNTIRITVYARRKEINIMKYVGATNGFIRFPFFVEGITIGVIAALIGFGGIWAAYYYISRSIASSTMGWVSSIASSFISFSDIWYYVLAAFLIVGILVGTLGCTLSVRKHLRV